MRVKGEDRETRPVGDVAHDLNNLLMVITSNGELLRRGLEPEDPRLGKVQHIMDAAERASRLVKQLLAASGTESPGPTRDTADEDETVPGDSSTEI